MSSHEASRADFGTGVDQSAAVFKREGAVPMPVRITKAALWVASWGVTIWWFSLFFRLPSDEGKAWKREVAAEVGLSPFWGKYATNYVLYVAPVIFLAILALLYLELEERFPERVRCSSREQSMVVRLYRAIWTQPLFVKTPIGVITFIDIVVIVIVFVCAAWIWGELLVPQFIAIDAAKPKKGIPKWALKWDKTSDMLGRALPFTIAVLFIPVARGSPILRLIDVPFEQAVKYHRWIGYLTVLLVFVHGATYGVYAGAIHKIELLIEWPYSGCNNLAGTISCVAAIIMGFTSIPYVRSRHFNTFFTMHHLYLIFFAFYVFHVDWNHVGQSMGPVILFFIDRFLRMVQSRRQVTGVSARILPSGLVELKIPRQPGFKYNTLSFLYLNIPGISRLQWHPFSTSSSPLDDDNAVSVHIKPLGDWTTVLHNNIAAKSVNDAKLSGCPFALKLQAEGPYGHETNYFLRYRNLILVAGGAGVTPYLAMIHDLLKRHQLQQEGLPTNVQLIWCVRRRSELATLQTIIPSHIYPGYGYQQSTGFALNIQAYVTGEAATGGQDEVPMIEMSRTKIIRNLGTIDSPQKGVICNHKGISTINSYQNLWMIALILASMTGFVLVSALFYNYVTAPKLQPKGQKYNMAMETLLHFVSLFVGIVICGGSVIFFWISTESSSRTASESSAGYGSESKIADLEGNEVSTLLDSCIVTEGSRPQFKGHSYSSSLVCRQ
ncbi:hypothetical protein M758_2G074700 [Ceratodon purpureus]|nr:hypothetical protein M758_2G074700 [Ceratodon purpureus]